MKKKYYKVLTNYYGMLQSARRGNVFYSFGTWTNAPKNTRLFVFDNLIAASNFVLGERDKVFECEIVGGIEGKGAWDISDTNDFWKLFNSFVKKKKKVDFKKIGEKFDLTLTPAILVKKVKLVREIK
jgi:hypothetical protein